MPHNTPSAWPVTNPWRIGRKVGRTIYIQAGDYPSDDDQIIGLMDSTDLAEHVVHAHNEQIGWVAP